MATNVAPITPGSGIGVAVDIVAENLTGTVSKNGTTTVTGSSTVFTTELYAGGVIRIPGTSTEDRIIAAIASDTSLTTTVAFTNTASGQTGQRVSAIQKVKAIDATVGSVTGLGISSNPTRVDPTGTTTQPVRNRPSVLRTRVASSGLTTSVTAYTVGDQAGTMLSFTSAASATGGTGTILSAVLLDKGDVGTDYRLHFFRSNVTLASDNAAFAVSDADMQDWCGEVVMPSLRDLGANRASSLGNIGLGYDTGAGTTLYVAIETRTANAVYAAATDLNLTLTLILD